ncbi:hypothetical protein FKP32DRAFT_1586837 [Trametes sanguinea]|nr:hypothetical protein FKP32DRAFT_1586837 [Trametes sanguinea]
MSQRTPFTKEHDDLLAKYIAKYNPEMKGRSGRNLYQRLVENRDNLWPFSKHHTWQSWRERYVRDQPRFDKMIRKYIKQMKGSSNAEPAESTSSQPSTQQAGGGRVFYTREDDDRLVEYLATHQGSGGALLGQKFWMTMEEEADQLPWIKRHSWQSWRERYKKNVDFFDWAVRRHTAGEDPNDPPVPRPKTVEEHVVRKPTAKARVPTQGSSSQGGPNGSQAATHVAEKRKRPAVGDSNADQRSAKKARAEELNGPQAEAVVPDAAGPSRSPPQQPRTEHSPVEVEHSDQQSGAEKLEHDEASAEDPNRQSDAEDSEEDSEEENLGPPGSDEYNGEIFSPSKTDAEALQDEESDGKSTSGDSIEDDGDEELDQLLEADGAVVDEAQVEQDGMDIDDATMQPEEDTAANQDFETGNGADESPQQISVQDGQRSTSVVSHNQPPLAGSSALTADHIPSECTESHTPPPRKHNARIRTTEVPLITPELSPTEEAAARHHEPRPLTTVRRHPKRIMKRSDEDFFGTPPAQARPASPDSEDEAGEPSSPAAEAEARHHAHSGHHDHEQEEGRQTARQPPRLDAGAFNKAFSDVRGRSRVSPSSTPRRRSGADLGDDGSDRNEEHASELLQWSAKKNKGKGNAVAAGTPSQSPSPVHTPTSKGKGRERTVRTEEFVSIRTVRTVERKVGRRPVQGTPFPRHLAAASDSEDEDEEMAEPEAQADESDADMGPEGDGMEVEGGEDDDWPSPSQHHPFSQVPHPFSQQAEPPSYQPSARPNGPPLPKADLSRVQRLLHSPPLSQDVEASRSAMSHAEEHTRLAKNAPLAQADLTRLDKILRMEGKHAFPEPSKLDRQSVSSERVPGEAPMRADEGRVVADPAHVSRFSRRGTSPLAGRGGARSGSAERRGEIVPPPAAGSSRVDKGKRRADEISSDARSRRYTVGGDVFYPKEAQEELSRPRRRARQSVPPAFTLGDDGLFANRSALSLALRPPPRAASRAASVPATVALSRSVSPAKSGDVSLADTLPPHELEMVKELGMNTALHIMARNHGFSEETVRQVYAVTGSLEIADNVLREMREGANEKASEALTSLLHDEDEQADGEEMEMDEDMSPDEFEGSTPEEVEVERELTQQPEWHPDGLSLDFDDEAPLAESSRIDASHLRDRHSMPETRRAKHQFRIERLVDSHGSSIGSEYTPPKHTRAARFVRRGRDSLVQGRPGSAPPATTVNAATANSNAAEKPKTEEVGDIAFSDLARLDRAGWQRLEEKHGRGFAKILAGKALAKLLQQ